MAQQWTIIQHVNTNNMTMTQTDASDSIQGKNVVNFPDGTLVNGEQIFNADTESLTQDGTTSDSIQKNNLVIADTIVISYQEATLNDVTLNQIGDVDSSYQGINGIYAETVTAATQTVTLDTGTLTQDTTGSDNEQALNEAHVDTTITALAQTVNATAGISLNQGETVSGGSNIQAINDVDGSGLVVDGTVSQTINAGVTVALNQNAAAGDQDEQAGNRLDTGEGTVAASGSVTQLINGDGSTTLDFIQVSSANNIIQAGNLIKVVGTDAGSSVTQTVQNIDTADFVQDETVHAVQAGNAIISNTHSASTIQATQSFSATTSVDLIQTEVNGSVQSVNLAGVF
jgi:hypothetical protein